MKSSGLNMSGTPCMCLMQFCIQICDMIKGNESLVKKFNFFFLTPLSHNFKMLHFYANTVTIGYLVTEL